MAEEQKYGSIVTPYGKSAQAKFFIGGPTISTTYMAVGDGGGAYYMPEEGQEALKSEVHEFNLNSIYISPDNPAHVVFEGYIPENVGGFYIREVCVKDAEKNVIGIGNYGETYKSTLAEGAPGGIVVSLMLEVSNTACISFVMDQTGLLVTKDELERHIKNTKVHGATYEATPERLLIRDDGGRVQVGKPVRAADAARLQEITDVIDAMGHLTDSGVPLAKAYTGDGQTTRFSVLGLLSDNPQALLVTHDGIEQTWGDDYTVDLSGAMPEVIFDIAPPDGVNIHIRTMVTLTQSQQATEGKPGVVQVATSEEVKAGVDDTKIVTPKKLHEAAFMPLFLGEFYFFRHPILRPGFLPAQGGLLENAATLYPEIWAYLQTAEGQLLCKTEAEWQAMTTWTWHTLADGTKVGFDGIGGAPFFAPNLATGALRLPDIRGMSAEAAGCDGLGVGAVHGDYTREATGAFTTVDVASNGVVTPTSGCFFNNGISAAEQNGGAIGYNTEYGVSFRLSRQVPVGNKFSTRAYGSLACVYLGAPAS